jgi:hypothetical protein
MKIKLVLIVLAAFAMPANALDGRRLPATVPPAVVIQPGDNPNVPYWHNPNLQRAAKELSEQSRQLRRDADKYWHKPIQAGRRSRNSLWGLGRMYHAPSRHSLGV